MGFLIRTAFWFSLVLLALPLDPNGEGENVGPLQAFFAAREAVADVAGICERKPDVCSTGKAAMHTVSVRAREGARIAFEMLDDKNLPVDTGTDAVAAAIDALESATVETTGSIKLPAEAEIPAPKG